ncbi:kinase-like domain-containing protein [Mycena floridula]|nr:kinase-like domain-containing protein [Mycena floridula]
MLPNNRRGLSAGQQVIIGQMAVSLGKTVAQVTAMFAPIPGLSPAAELLCGIIQLCQNVSHNKNAAKQLRDRCHTLLLAVKESITISNEPMTAAVDSLVVCLQQVHQQFLAWSSLSYLQAFQRQAEICRQIQDSHAALENCLTKFQLVSHNEIHHWQEEFGKNAQLDHMEIVNYLSDILNSQAVAEEAQHANQAMLQSLMSSMQQLMGQNRHIADRQHIGLASNLYEIQNRAGTLLPHFHLDSGEVTRMGQFPVSGTAAMDIYEGLYLQREKVCIKIVRAVNSSDQSYRRFMREAQIWAKIWERDQGRHVLAFYGFCQTDGPFPYMVSPWQANGNALTYVKLHDHEVDHIRMIKYIAEGIEILHTMDPPIVHGDIKAANIVIDSKGNPLIADFGLSRVVEDITGIPFTQSRGVSDSYRWFGPEVCVGQGVLSLASDMWAFGMTVLEASKVDVFKSFAADDKQILTHSQPFANIKHTTEVVIRSSSGEKPPRPTEPRVLERGLNNELWALLNDCWSVEPSDRPSIKQVIQRLAVL